jgi:hypothetical protein
MPSISKEKAVEALALNGGGFFYLSKGSHEWRLCSLPCLVEDEDIDGALFNVSAKGECQEVFMPFRWWEVPRPEVKELSVVDGVRV